MVCVIPSHLRVNRLDVAVPVRDCLRQVLHRASFLRPLGSLVCGNIVNEGVKQDS